MSYQIHQNQIPERLVSFEGKEYRWLGGTNYLNIGTHPIFQEKLQEGISLFSQNWGSSRLNNYRMDVWESLENVLAKRFHMEATALCSSGLIAGQIALQYITQKHPEASITLAPKTHPALWRHPHKPETGSFANWKKYAQILCMDGIGSPWVEEFLTGFDQNLSKDLHQTIRRDGVDLGNFNLLRHKKCQRKSQRQANAHVDRANRKNRRERQERRQAQHRPDDDQKLVKNVDERGVHGVKQPYMNKLGMRVKILLV
jgi:hypothetical protein